MNLFYSKIIFIFFAVSLLSSCSSDKDEDGVPDDLDKCPDTPLGIKVDKHGCPIERKLGNIHFYLDNSASMAGYFNKDAEFKTIISDITSKVDKHIKPIDISFISEAIEKYPNNAQQFSSDIATTRIADKDGYQLHDMISKIAAKNDTNDVSILVSDCILSFSDAAIKKNPEINKTEAPNSLKNNIYDIFSDLKKRDIATSIYAFHSAFYGKYYDYQGLPIDLTNKKVERPFYIIVIGHKELLGSFSSQLADISTFNPDNSLHFGLSEQPITQYDIIPQIERKGSWMKCDNGIKDIEISKGEQLKFCVALNLNNLPPYAKSIKYLQEKIQIESYGAKATFEAKDKTSIDRSKLKSEPQIALFTRATHVLIFDVKSMDLSEAKIKVKLPQEYDTWYLAWSCMDDKDVSKLEGRTFAFEYLIKGLQEAYDTKNKDYINLLITLNK